MGLFITLIKKLELLRKTNWNSQNWGMKTLNALRLCGKIFIQRLRKFFTQDIKEILLVSLEHYRIVDKWRLLPVPLLMATFLCLEPMNQSMHRYTSVKKPIENILVETPKECGFRNVRIAQVMNGLRLLKIIRKSSSAAVLRNFFSNMTLITLLWTKA